MNLTEIISDKAGFDIRTAFSVPKYLNRYPTETLVVVKYLAQLYPPVSSNSSQTINLFLRDFVNTRVLVHKHVKITVAVDFGNH